MRRILIALLMCAGLLALSGCGNKGPLVRAPARSARPAPAPAASARTPQPAASVFPPAPASAAAAGPAQPKRS